MGFDNLMYFLLTNDDGVSAPGIWAAARVLSQFGNVLIVAPSNNCSGYGTAFPPGQTPAYHLYHHPEGHPSNVTACGLDSTPSACAHAALTGAFGDIAFDMVVSGINLGSNMGRDVFYSGTVGAALTAQAMGLPAIAISLDVNHGESPDWSGAEWALGEAVKMALMQNDEGPLVYNVNVPNRPAKALLGMQLAGFSKPSFLDRTRFVQNEAKPGTLKVLYMAPTYQPEEWTDGWVVQQGYVAITPIQPMPELMRVAPWVSPREMAPALHTFDGWMAE